MLIEQHQHAEAGKLLDEVLKQQPAMLPAWQTKIWSDLAGHAYSEALADMRTAAGEMEKLDADPGGAVTEQRGALAGLMGRGVGFLAATAKTGITTERLKAGRQEILAKVGPDRAAFLIAEQAMASEIAALDQKLEAAGHAQDAAAAQRQEKQSEKTRAAGKQVDQADFEVLKNKTDSATELRSADAGVDQLRLALAKAQFDLKAVELALNAQLGMEQFQQGLLTDAQDRVSRSRAPDPGLQGRGVINVYQNMQRMNNNVRQLMSQQRLAHSANRLPANELQRGHPAAR